MCKKVHHTPKLSIDILYFRDFILRKLIPDPYRILWLTLPTEPWREIISSWGFLKKKIFSWMNIDPISVASVQFHMAVCTTQHSRKFLNHNFFSQTFPSIHLLLIIFWAQAYFFYCYNYISIILLLYFVFFITFTLSTTVIWVII